MCEVLDEHGIDSREVLAQAGLPRRLPEMRTTTNAETSISFRRAFVAATDRRRKLWSIVASRLVMQTTSPYTLATRTARDIESVVAIIENIDLDLCLIAVVPLHDRQGQLVGIEFDASPAPPDLRAYEEVVAVTAHIRNRDSIWAGTFPYRRMELPPSLSLEAIHRQNHAGIVRTSGRPRLLWLPNLSSQPLLGATRHLHRGYLRDLESLHEELRRSKNIGDRVVEQLRTAGGAACSIGQVAREVGISTRSLQRALADQGLTFRALRDSVLREVATSRLRETLDPIAQIATDLGYTSPTSFSDAFRTWFGQSPSDFRVGVNQENSAMSDFAGSRR